MMKPLGDRVLVKPLKAEEKTKSGIVIPDNAKEAPAEGKVVAIGTGIVKGKEYKFSVKVGDRVLFEKYASDITVDNEEYKIMREEEILGIM